MLADVESFLKDPAPMQGLVEDVKADILQKTARGVDYNGRLFAPLSKAYAKKTGKSRSNMRESGRMLDSITAKALTPSHGQVKVNDEELIAQFHNQGGPKSGRPPKREFMNVTPSFLAGLVKKWFDDRIMQILGRR